MTSSTRIIASSVALGTVVVSGSLRAQTSADGRTDASATSSGSREQAPPAPPTRDELARMFAENGGSLLRTEMGALADPSLGPGGPGSIPRASPEFEAVSFFAVKPPEPRILKKFDLVTVIVREQSEFKSSGTTELKKDASLQAVINEFVQLNLADLALESALGTYKPRFDITGKREFNGEGATDRKDSFSARIQARVLDVLPNDTIVLEARKVIRTDDDEQTIILSGTARASDIMADNTVLSTQLYDLRLEKSHKGPIRDSTRRGWFSKLLDALNPF